MSTYRSLWKLALAALFACGLVVVVPQADREVGALVDVQAPVVTAFDFTPKTIDLSTGDATVDFTVTITDDISGVSGSPYLVLRGPDNDFFSVWLGRTAGDELDGTYSGSLVVSNPYTANGIWLFEYLPLVDLANNSSTTTITDLIAAGWPTELTVTGGIVDVQAPVVTAFDFTPTTIDLSTGGTTIEFTATITDDISGVSGWQYVILRGPDSDFFEVWLGRTAGDELDGTYSGSLVVTDPYTAEGIWLVEYLSVHDLANNATALGYADFVAAGWPTELTITSGEVPYDVVAFGAPIDNGMTNVARAGRTIPVKWNVSLSGAPVSDPAHFVSVTSAPVTAGETTLGTDVIEVYSGQSGLQYLGGGWWQFNWKVPKAYAGLTRVMTLTLDDGSTFSAVFEFR